MVRQLWLHNLVTEELKRCKKLYKDLKRISDTLPTGSLLDRNGRPYRAYREGKTQYQKPIRSNKLVQELKLRQFLKKGLPFLQRRIEICSMFLKREQFYDPAAILDASREIYHDIPEYDLFLEDDMDPEVFKNGSYYRNPAKFEEEHYTEGDVQVRSKSEAMIGTQVEHRSWLYRCEPLIRLPNENAYPDFQIMLPNTRRIVYLEHFGRMGDPKYVKKTMHKLTEYNKVGLYLGINLFFTWETKDKPLTLREINSVLDQIEALDQI